MKNPQKLPPPGCPKSPQFRARSAFCATLEGVEAPEGAFFGQAPPKNHKKLPENPPSNHQNH